MDIVATDEPTTSSSPTQDRLEATRADKPFNIYSLSLSSHSQEQEAITNTTYRETVESEFYQSVEDLAISLEPVETTKSTTLLETVESEFYQSLECLNTALEQGGAPETSAVSESHNA